MLEQELLWFLTAHAETLRKGDKGSFETLMVMALANLFGMYTANELAAYLGISAKELYSQMKSISLYQVRKLLLSFMVKQAVQELTSVLSKSGATQSRANIALHGDNSVLERVGKKLRCTFNWYSGHCKRVVNGNDLLGIVLTINGRILPLHLRFCSKQGRANTRKPELLVTLLAEVKAAFAEYEIDITQFPLTLDSWFASEALKQKLWALGFKRLIVAGKSSYRFTIKGEKRLAKEWKQTLTLAQPAWGIDVEHLRLRATSPTFGSLVLLFFRKQSTRIFYLMDLSEQPRRSAEIWRVWKTHHCIEQFWRLLKSVFRLKSIQLRGDGLYTGLLIKVMAYIMTLRFKAKTGFENLSVVQLLRKLRRQEDFDALINEHFHDWIGAT